jgi:hypothetical protein
METKIPYPGSKEAIERGCTCPVKDNHYGKGVPYPKFWVTEGCPLHGIDLSDIPEATEEWFKKAKLRLPK